MRKRFTASASLLYHYKETNYNQMLSIDLPILSNMSLRVWKVAAIRTTTNPTNNSSKTKLNSEMLTAMPAALTLNV